MKRSALKDATRNILKKGVSYISVVFITMLAVMAYLGIDYAAKALRQAKDDFYHALCFRDLEIYSSKLFSEDDLRALQALDGVETAEAVRMISGLIRTEDGRQEIYVSTMTTAVNQVRLLEGALPEKRDECALERELADALGLAIGDTLTVTDSLGEKPAALAGNCFTVSGIVFHPDHYITKKQLDEPRYVLVTDDAFDNAALDGRYMKLVLRAATDQQRYSKAYDAEISALKHQIEALSDDRRIVYTSDLTEKTTQLSDAQEELHSSEIELERASVTVDSRQQDIESGKAELAENNTKLKDAEQELSEARTELDNAEKQLADAKAKLDDGKNQLDKAKLQLDGVEEQLVEAEKTLAEKKEQLNAADAQLRDAEIRLRNAFDAVESQKTAVRMFIRGLIDPDDHKNILWAEPVSSYDLEDDSISIKEFRITSTVSYMMTGDLDQELRYWLNGLQEYLDVDTTVLSMFELAQTNSSYAAIRTSYAGITEQMDAWEKARQEYIAGKQQYKTALEAYQDGETQYQQGLAEYRKGYAAYVEKKSQYETSLVEYYEGQNAYTKGKTEYENGRSSYDDGMKQYASAEGELSNGEKALADGIRQLDQARAELAEGREKLHEAQKALEQMEGEYRWIVLDTSGNAGFYAADNVVQKIFALGMTFGLLFLLVGAMVLYSSIARMVNEQSKQIGTEKALGFFRGEIMGKYLLYAVSAVLTGLILGILISYYGVQPFAIRMYLDVYVTRHADNIFALPDTLLTVAGGILVAVLAAWAGCRSLLSHPARELLAGDLSGRKVRKHRPPGASRIRFPLYFRLIARNIRSDHRRVMVTTISIIECCILMVIGLTFADNLKGTLQTQYSDIITYHYALHFDPDVNADAEQEIAGILDKNGISYLTLTTSGHACTANGLYDHCTLITGEPETISSLMHLTDPEPVTIPQKGVLIPTRLSRHARLEKGDTLTFFDDNMNTYTARTAGTFDYYFGQVVIASSDSYAVIFGKAPVTNTFWIPDDVPIPDDVRHVKGLSEITDMEQVRKMQDDYIASSEMISRMLIIIAGLMTYFIILDLVNMYVLQKKRELTIMRINGFTIRETVLYAALECIFTTVIGIVIGCLAGSLLGDLVVTTQESRAVSFVHRISVHAWLISGAMTFTFSFVMHLIAFSKIRKYKIADITEAV